MQMGFLCSIPQFQRSRIKLLRSDWNFRLIFLLLNILFQTFQLSLNLFLLDQLLIFFIKFLFQILFRNLRMMLVMSNSLILINNCASQHLEVTQIVWFLLQSVDLHLGSNSYAPRQDIIIANDIIVNSTFGSLFLSS